MKGENSEESTKGNKTKSENPKPIVEIDKNSNFLFSVGQEEVSESSVYVGEDTCVIKYLKRNIYFKEYIQNQQIKKSR